MFAAIEPRPDRCELCRFGRIEGRFVPPPPHSIMGYGGGYETTDVIVCKRMPPTPGVGDRGVSPVVFKGDYCGEFKEKEA